MGKRGQKPKGQVKIKWSPNFAYAIGLITSDGCLSADGRHILFVSKDLEQIKNFAKALDLRQKIGKHSAGFGRRTTNYHRIQFGDILFYKFLLGIGLTPDKSKTVGQLSIPHKYFFDFLRGSFDGDGYFYSYWDKRWRSSFMFYLGFCSASPRHLLWLQKELKKLLGVKGHITHSRNSSCQQLKYAKKEAVRIIRKLYPPGPSLYLSRKRLKTGKALAIVS